MTKPTGFILLDKPKGFSSNRILQKVKRLMGADKAGHSGTLDPMATGMLPIALGRATRLNSFLLEADKCYRTTLQLGELRTTGDAEGEVVSEAAVPELTEASLQTALEKFTGDIKQIPPMFSALKHQGKKLYELARQGIEIERKPRPVTIYSIECLSFDVSSIELQVRCSKGTYIRTLGEDIAQALGTVGYLSALRREYCAGFDPVQLVTWEQLQASKTPLDFLIPTEAAVDWPHLSITELQRDLLLQGKTLYLSENIQSRVLLFCENTLVAFAEIDGGEVMDRTFLI